MFTVFKFPEWISLRQQGRGGTQPDEEGQQPPSPANPGLPLLFPSLFVEEAGCGEEKQVRDEGKEPVGGRGTGLAREEEKRSRGAKWREGRE